MNGRLISLLCLVAGLGVIIAPFPDAVNDPEQRIFRIEARQFSYLPSALDVNVGDRITIELVSTDVVHGIYVDGYNISAEADPGQTVALTFVADQEGTFRFRCHVSCGAMHPFMIGRLTVGRDTWFVRSLGLAVLAVVGTLASAKYRS